MRNPTEVDTDLLAHQFAVIQIHRVEVFDMGGTPVPFIDPAVDAAQEIGCIKCDLSLDDAYGKPCFGSSDEG